MQTRKGTCDGCGKVRKLTKPEDKTREVMYHADGRKKLLSSAEHVEACKLLIHYYWLCSECFPEVETQADIVRLRKEKRDQRAARGRRFAYPCVGGPLDGEHATTDDFYREGMYAHLSRDYFEFNGACSGTKRLGAFPPSMIFVHRDALKPLAAPRDR